MSKILQVKYDLLLTYSWSSNNHGVCGHTYEVIDYFYILKNNFNVGILLAEDITWDIFESAIRDKYSFTEEEIQLYKDKTIFFNRPLLLKCNNILFVDGGITSINDKKILCNNIILLACGDKEIKDNVNEKIHILQDDRVYDSVKLNGVNYKKKILFDKYKPIGNSKNNMLLYGTKNCRNIPDGLYNKLLKQYQGSFIVLTNEENKRTDLNKRFLFLSMPVKNLFSQFNTYVYTNVPRKFDCSPRFIAECKFYNKEVIYDIDYLEEDKGLYWRKYDVENDFESINLTKNDDIISILNNII